MSLQEFEIKNKLGSGSFAEVFRCIKKLNNKQYALKKVKINQMNEKDQKNAVNELRLLASIRDPFIIQYKQAFIHQSQQILCIVMEYANQGDLHQLINRYKQQKQNIEEPIIWKCLIQISAALNTLHQIKVIHRDVKAPNVFVFYKDQEINFKLGDLNVSKQTVDNLVYSQIGTPGYASPEIWRNESYSYKSDIWSLGCLIYQMSNQHLPFEASNLDQLFQKVQEGIYPVISNYSDHLCSLIDWMLKPDPKHRPSCQQILDSYEVKVNGSSLLDNVYQQCQSSIGLKLVKNIQLKQTDDGGLDLAKMQSQLPKQNYSFEIENPKTVSTKKRVLSANYDGNKLLGSLSSRLIAYKRNIASKQCKVNHNVGNNNRYDVNDSVDNDRNIENIRQIQCN